jgi:serine phosphatase RsbU (regulator of sigma subunit)
VTGPPLAAGITAERAETTVDLPPDSTLVLYTDGLVERRGESIDLGLKRLQVAAEELLTTVDDETDLDDVLDELSEAVSDPDRQDDVAVLAFRRTV